MTDSSPRTDLERTIRAEIVEGERPDRPVRRLARRFRAWAARHPALDLAYRITIGIAGGLLTLIGLVLVPLPGPGWLVVFLGLALLGTEFRWARRIANALKRMLDRFWAWFRARRARRSSATGKASQAR